MDPIVIGVIVLLVIVLALRMFFGIAKLVVKLAVVAVILIVLWRLFLAGA
jgi:hypothetical protein